MIARMVLRLAGAILASVAIGFVVWWRSGMWFGLGAAAVVLVGGLAWIRWG